MVSRLSSQPVYFLLFSFSTCISLWIELSLSVKRSNRAERRRVYLADKVWTRNDRETMKHTCARVHTTHTGLFLGRGLECRCYTKQKSSDLLSSRVMYVGKTTMHRTKIKSSLRRWSFLSVFFLSSSLCDACVRREQHTGVSVVLVDWKRVGLLVVVISRVHNHTHVLSSSFSLSHSRAFFHRV